MSLRRLPGTKLRHPSFPPPRSDWKMPLLAVLVVPFVLQVVAAVGLTAYLSYRNGQQVVNNLASQLAAEVGNRVEQSLSHDLQTPAEMTRNNVAALRLDILDSRDRPSLERYFEQQLKIFDGVNLVALADERKNFLGVAKRSDGSIAIQAQAQANDDVLNRYLANVSGTAMLLSEGDGGDDRERQAGDDWYLAAKAAKKPLWRLAVRLAESEQAQPVLTAVNFQPFYDRANRFQGVLAASVSLSKLGSVLKRLKVAETGRVFIVEQNGLLIAGSNDDRPFRRLPGKRLEPSPAALPPAAVPPSGATYRRMSAVSSSDFLTQQAALSVVEHFEAFDRVQGRQQFRFEVDSQCYFVHIEPVVSDQSLNWLAVVVVPEADFAEAINGNNQLTLWLCAGAFITAIVLSWLTSAWIARPILRLSRASRELALGEWHYPVNDESRVAELEVLAHSFNQMAVHLQRSFDQVKTALQESEAKFTKVFRASPDAITIALLPERRYIDVNDRFLEFTGYTREEAIGQSAVSLSLVVDPAQVDRFEQLLHAQNRVRDAEIDYYTRQGQLRTVLVSSDVIELEGQTCLLSLYRDITARKQAEAALLESEQRFRKAFDTTAVGMCLTAPDGRFLQVNASLCQMLGYTEAELLTLTFPEITDPDDLDVTLAYAQKLLAGKISYYHLKKRYWHKDGHTIWCLLSVSLVRGRKQQPLYFVAQMQNMTHQQTALDERERAEATMRTANLALKQKVAELSTLNHITQTVATMIDLPRALAIVAALITDCFKADETSISLLDEPQATLQMIANHTVDPAAPSLVGMVFPIDQDYLATQVMQHRTVVLSVTDTTPGTELLRQMMQARDRHCLMTVGIWLRGEAIGLITLAVKQSGRVFTPDEVNLAETIAGQIASTAQSLRSAEAQD